MFCEISTNKAKEGKQVAQIQELWEYMWPLFLVGIQEHNPSLREELQGQGTIPEELYNHLSSRLKQVQGTDSNIEEQNRNQVKRRFKVEAWSQESVSNQLTKPKDQHGSQYGQLCAASFPS